MSSFRICNVVPLIVIGLALCLASTTTWADETADSEKQIAKIQAALKSANPDYQNGGTFTYRKGKLVAINLMRCKGISELSPLKNCDLSNVKSVTLYNAVNISDISPLRGCRLTSLNLERCNKIIDLSPLKGMSLKWFRMYACASVKDLTPLQGMPLEHLDVGLNPLIDDISALEGMPLHDLRIDQCPQIKSIAVLKGMPLKFLSVHGCKSVGDFSPLDTLKLETLYFSPLLLSKEELQAIRNMKSLKRIGTSWADYRKEPSPDQFWKRFDQGEFRAKE